MALLRAAALPEEGSPAWLPTHVQVTVIRARGLRCKGGGGGSGVTSDAYTVIQLGREKYSTSVAEKSRGNPEWQEECAFELPPDMGTPAGLVLTVMHRALVGMDRFLGQALVPLEPALQRGRAPDERWHKLHSKAGKKEKERGEILVCIQFTRNSLTASMFDLSTKDKPRSAFGKLKDKVRGKKKYDLESASAIVPSSSAALGEEGGRKPTARGFFLKNKLRKSSLTQSSTSLGSDSSVSAASAAELPTAPSGHSGLAVVKDFLPSPKLTHKRAFSDDISQVSPVLEPKPIPNLKPKNDPVSSSSLCINGSHVYGDQPAPKSPGTLPPSSAPLAVPGVPRRQEESFGFTPLHPDSHEVPWGMGSFERAQQREEPRFIPSPPSLALQEELKVSTKAVTLSNHLGRARMEESGHSDNKPTQAAAPMVFSPETAKDKQPEEARKEEKKAKGGLFHHGANRSEVGSKVGASHGSAVHAATGGDERSKTSGWFGSKESKESPQKPSLEVSPQVETSSDAPSHFPPCSPAPWPPAALAHLARMPRSNLPAALRDAQPGCLSPTNPFLNSLQSNPFFEDLLADQVLNSPSPTHFFSSFPAEPHDPTEVAENFCSSEDCSPSVSLRHKDPERESPAKSVGVPVPETTPPAPGDLPPPPPPPLEDEKPAVPPPLSEWDDTFDAFATSRLNPEQKKEKFFPSVGEEGMAFIDDPDAANPTERPAEGAAEGERKVLAEADPPTGSEMPTSLRSWSDFFGLDVGANLVSTTQEATVIEDVPSPVSVGSVGKRRKSSTPTVWMAGGNQGEEETSTPPTTDNNAGEEEDSGEEEPSGAGTNGWMTIATETAPDLPEDTLSVAEPERPGQEGAFSPHPTFLGPDAFEAKSGSRVPRSTLTPELSSEPLAAGNVAAVPPRVLAEPRGGEEEAFDIRTSVYRLQASLRVEAGEGRVKLSSDVRERHVVVSPWAGTREREELASGSAVPPPKPPRWFAAVGRDGEEEEEERGEDVECPKADVEMPKSHLSDEPSVPAPPSPPPLGTGIAGAGSEFLVPEDAESGTVGSAADLEARPSGLAAGDTSLVEEQSKLNETDTVEQFETCPSKFSLDGFGQLGVKESWSQLGLSSADGAKWETGLNPPSKLDQAETFWTALEEEETTARPADLNPATQPQRLEQGEIPPEPDPGDGDRQPGPVTVPAGRGGARPEAGSPVATAGPSREAEQGRPPSGEPEGSWRRRSAASRIDFKKADFWKVDREEERCEQEASTPRNPFANTPSNPFVEKPPTPLPIQAVPPEKLDQGSFSFTSFRQETPWRGSRPTNLLREPPFLHDNQPLAFSTPFLVAATNPKQFDFPSPVACPASSGVPSASSRAAAQPRPLPQSGGDAQASALVVLPRETQPAEKPFFQQTTSPHPVKPISAAVQEVSSEKKQQHRSSLSTALSNGLEKLKTVTTSSIQPVAPSSPLEKTDSQLKDPTTLDQSAKYYHLTHDELIQLLLQREKELSKKEEHIQELENYIDQLLVRIMEQSPTLLQIPLEESKSK